MPVWSSRERPSSLKSYAGAAHGMLSTRPEVLGHDLQAFVEAPPTER